ncbi:MAG: hypothetical protein PCFJNLEI_03569 [Verrucomicrobiae bacterium]|nr:hypothetical protein [Verrucomicrobiae bacterium]
MSALPSTGSFGKSLRHEEAILRKLKFGIALLLLPACVGATLATAQLGRVLLTGTTAQTAGAFGAGYGLWLLIFCFLPKPVRTYVLGHELTHALWAWLMGARVSGLKVGKAGGQVHTSKTNWAITLAPYFFPFYAILFMLLFFLGHWIWDWSGYMGVLFFLIGFGWSFHVTFTIMVLFSVSQPDVESQGVLFSFTIIYLMNLLTMTVVATLLSPTLTWEMFASTTGKNVWQGYAWTLDKLHVLWEYGRVVWSNR